MRIVILAAALLALTACSQPPQQPAAEDPAITAPGDLVRSLYGRYLNPDPNAPFPALEEQAPWSAAMRQELVDMIARSNAADAPILDFDPFVNARDGATSALRVETESVVDNSHAVVRASFMQDTRAEEVVYDLIWENGAWRIDNMRSADWDLRQIARSDPG